MRWWRLILPVIFVLAGPGGSAAQAGEGWVVSRFAEPPFTPDGALALEGVQVAPPFSWHARVHLRYQYSVGLANRASQIILHQRFGLGLPARLEVGLGFPVGWTIGALAPPGIEAGPRPLEGMGEEGPAIGDLRLALLFSALDGKKRAVGLLVGLTGGIPTGMHERLMGEGGFSLEPLVSLAFQVFGSRLSLNVLYRWRPEHMSPMGDGQFEQDDDVVWRVGVRVPRRNDVAWSIEAEGAVGVLTSEKGWPSAAHRPVVLGAGLDFPLGRLHRLGFNVAVGVTGEAAPGAVFGMSFWWVPVLPDEDKDGVSGLSDECQLMKEDWDGFQDEDGCPDPDNDKDGFPDAEDRCPMEAGDDFSEDGCPEE